MFLPADRETGDTHGTMGLSNLEYAPICEVLGRSSIASEAVNCSAPDTGNMEVFARYGTAEHKEKWLKPLLNGEIRSCFSMTEPDAGSDVQAIRTIARREGDEFVIDGNKVAQARASAELRAAEFEFEANEVYALDVVFSTGEGKPRCLDEKATNVYKRQLDKRYSVKMKAARALMGEIGKRAPILPFSGRALGLESRAGV
jgi:hypothetical protein